MMESWEHSKLQVQHVAPGLGDDEMCIVFCLKKNTIKQQADPTSTVYWQ